MPRVTAVLIATGVGGAFVVGALSAPPSQGAVSSQSGPLLPRPAFLRTLGASQTQLFADFYWLRTINEIGSASQPEDYRNAYFLADLVTDLDPRFRSVYPFVSVALPVHVGDGKYVNADLSTKLIRKGLEVFPDEYRLRFQLAYNLGFLQGEPKQAGDILTELSREPDSPSWLGALATRMYAESGDLETSELLTKALLASSEDDESRVLFEKRLREIELERILLSIDAAVARFEERMGRPPVDLSVLLAAGDLVTLPPDPLGGTYFIHADGRSRSTENEHRLELIQNQKTRDASAASADAP